MCLCIAVSATVYATTSIGEIDNNHSTLPPPPRKVTAPTFDEVQLAAQVIHNAVEQSESVQHIQLVYSLRNQQHLTRLAQLQAEQAKAQVEIARAQIEQQQLLTGGGTAVGESQKSATNTGQLGNNLAPPEPDPLTLIRLASIITGRDGTYSATVVLNGRRYTVRQGYTVQTDIRVEGLTATSIVLSREDKRVQLYLN